LTLSKRPAAQWLSINTDFDTIKVNCIIRNLPYCINLIVKCFRLVIIIIIIIITAIIKSIEVIKVIASIAIIIFIKFINFIKYFEYGLQYL
jgi:hypothetical protein